MISERSASLSDHGSARRAGTVTIYILGTDAEDGVKIGKTRKSVRARRLSHEGRGPRRSEMHFLAGVRGHDADESRIHHHFREYLWPDETEWFTPAAPVVNWICWLRQQWYVAQAEDECDAIDLEASDHWMPAPGREAEPPPQLSFGPWGTLKATPQLTPDDFYTSPIIMDAVRDVMGHIDLDPASHPQANRTVKAGRIYTVETDGLAHPWHGRVWCNPPFNQWQEWAPKIRDEWRSGRVEEMCVLLATRSLTAKSVAPMLHASTAMCIPCGRIPFWGERAGSPDDGHAVLYFGRDPAAFLARFSRLGHVTQSPAKGEAA